MISRTLTCILLVFVSSFATLHSVAAQEDTNQNTANKLQIVDANESLQIGQQNRFELGEELLLTMSADKYKLSDIFTLVSETGLLIDFEEYMNAVEFPITQIGNNRVYQGWFISEEQTFTLTLEDLSKPIVTINGETYSIEPKLIQYYEDTLYIHEALFDTWFGISHTFKFSALRMRLNPKQKLPFQLRKERANKEAQRRGGKNKPIHQELERSYGVLSPQVLDVQLNARYQDSNNSLTGNYSILGSRDIAYLHADLFLSGSDTDLLSNSRLTLSRESIENDLLWGLNASKIEFGDIQPIRQGSTGNRSRGLLISNANTTNQFDIQEVNLTGLLPAGWDVELYRNGVLIDSATNVETGEYSFLDIQLLFGVNEFEVVKYGPQGQVMRERSEKLVDRTLLGDDKLSYGLSLTQNNRSLLGTQRISDDADSGYNFAADVSKTILGTRLGLGYQQGFGGDFDQSNLSLNANRVFFDKLIASTSVNINSEDNYSGNVNLQTNIMRQSVGLSFGQSYSKSDDPLIDDRVANNVRLNMQGALYSKGKTRIDYDNRLSLNTATDYELASFRNRLGLSTGIGRFYNNLEYRKETNLNEIDERFRGSISFQRNIGGVFTRFSASYNLLDEVELSSVSASANWTLSRLFSTRFSTNYNLLNDSYTVDSNIRFRTDDFNITSNLTYSSSSGWLAGLNASFSLSGQPLIYGDTFQTSRNIAQSGSLSVRVFVDANQNNKYDIGEVLVQGVKINTPQSIGRAVTDELGIGTLVGIPHNTITDVILETKSISDPRLVPVIDGVSIRFRRGIADSLDYPLIVTTEIEGTVSLVNNTGNEMAASRVPLNLINSKNEIVKTVVTEYDGYYVIDKVKSGTYFLEIDSTFIENVNLVPLPAAELIIDANNGDFVFQDFSVVRKKSVEGFIAVLGEFTSRNILNAYVKLNRIKLSAMGGNIKAREANSVMQLVGAFSQNQEELDKYCALATLQKLTCDVQKINYFY